MRHMLKLLAALLGLGLLWGCAHVPDATTGMTQPQTDPRELYALAAKQAENSSDYLAAFTVKETRTTDTGAVFTEETTLNCTVSGANSENGLYHVAQVTDFGGYTIRPEYVYREGKAYLVTDDCTFVSDMDAAAFEKRFYPAVLLSHQNYGAVQAESTDTGWKITFSDPIAAESWLGITTDPISAEGHALLGKDGSLQETACAVSFYRGNTRIDLQITGAITLAESVDPSGILPETTDALPVSDLDGPLLLLRAAGKIFCADTLRSQASETIYSQALSTTRAQQIDCSFSGSGASLQANMDYEVTLTTNRGISVNTRSESFEKGIFTRSVNSEAPVRYTQYTAEEVRTYCEDSILGGLFVPAGLSDIEITEEDGLYVLQMTGNTDYTARVLQGIYQLLGADLDSTSSSLEGGNVTGTLTVNAETGLPIKMALSFARTHVIGDVSYTLEYRLEQTLSFS